MTIDQQIEELERRQRFAGGIIDQTIIASDAVRLCRRLAKERVPWREPSEQPDANARVIIYWDNSYHARNWESNILGYDKSIIDYLFDTAEFEGGSFKLDRTDSNDDAIRIEPSQVRSWIYESELEAIIRNYEENLS